MISHHFKIITTGWHAGPWVKACVESIELQSHTDYDVCLVDDASGDPELTRYITEKCEERGWKSILRDRQVGAVKNQYDGIYLMNPDPDDVIVWLDMDDRFAHGSVLTRLIHYYDTTGCKMTYGSYEPDPPSSTCQMASAIPDAVRDSGEYRRTALNGGGIFWNHLRTVKHELYEQLGEGDFKNARGEWMRSTTDTVVMYPCLELARGAITFIPETLLIYNSENPLSDWRRQPRQVDTDHEWVLTRPRKA